MVKKHYTRKKTCIYHGLLLLWQQHAGKVTLLRQDMLNFREHLISKLLEQDIFYMHHSRQIAHTMTIATPVVEHWLEHILGKSIH